MRTLLWHPLLFGCLLLPAIPAAAQTTVWGLQQGDRFNVETLVKQQTTLELEGRPPTTATSKERIEIQYTVFSALPDETVVHARVTNITDVDDSQTAESARVLDRQSRQLGRVPVTMSIDPAGVVRHTQGLDAVIRQMSGVNKRSQKLLQQAVSKDAVATWVHQPFWLSPLKMPLAKEQSWERTSVFSLGLLGSVHTALTFSVSEADEESADITIAGNARHVPSAAGASSATVRLAFEDATAEVQEFGGSGRLILQQRSGNEDEDSTDEESRDEDDSEIDSARPQRPASRRPWFEQLQLEWKVTGTATVKSGDRRVPLKFEHHQTQTSRLLPGYVTGAPRRFTPFLPSPMPR
ncbi:DUF6263 family protein [Fuerstiella marisgermanici]|uniref:Uncharacterized protein n=1 Tax=Fuerstiella marisgermanici TaxID=1891926 RepID=A0A1P8WBB2_9PLAN|nr:DUF6263 family protein [Fuerstiella marisgermanici]APZ91350.1 hypothetical protein Fuma_00938 [Fuerstiella marisgermanici]